MLINTFSVFFYHIRIASVLNSRNKKSGTFWLNKKTCDNVGFSSHAPESVKRDIKRPTTVCFHIILDICIAYLHFPQGWVERAKNERAWKSTRARKGDTRLGDSFFARSTIPEEKWGTTRSLNNSPLLDGSNRKSANSFVDQNKKAFVILVPMTSIARNIGRKKKNVNLWEALRKSHQLSCFLRTRENGRNQPLSR